MHPITPHLWFDTQARDAAAFYVTVFPDSRVTSVTTLHDTPSGNADIVQFVLAGQPFQAISAGPVFRINPSVSFLVNFDPSRDPDARASLDAAWAKLAGGGTVLMPLGEYPFSAHYGWVQDRFGVSWQLMLTDPAGEPRPMLTPFLLFVGQNCGKAEAATDFYLSVFSPSRRGTLQRYGDAQAPDAAGTVMFTDIQLGEQWFAAMDSAHPHAFAFNEAVSFVVTCDTQAEIDAYWSKLSADPAA